MFKPTVLILDGQTVQALPSYHALKKSGYRVVAFCESKMSYGYASRYPDEKVIVPKTKDHAAILPVLLDYLVKNNVATVLPMNDDSAVLLSKYKKNISKHTEVLLPDYDTFSKGYDKNSLMALCQKLNIPHPATSDLEKQDLQQAANYVGFPAIIKPNITSGARGMLVVNNIEELKGAYPSINKVFGACHLQKFIHNDGRQFKVQIFTDLKADKYSSVMEKHRYYPVKGGSSTCNTTVQRDDLVEMCYKILDQLKWVGFADFDLIEDLEDGSINIMEINPRMPACIRSAFESGLDYATIIVDYTLSKGCKEYSYTPGKTLRFLGLDVLWFLKSPRRFSANPNWFKFFGSNISYEDGRVSDLLPFIYGTISNIKKQLNPSFRDAKGGLN